MNKVRKCLIILKYSYPNPDVTSDDSMGASQTISFDVITAVKHSLAIVAG